MKPRTPRDRVLVATFLALGGLLFATTTYVFADISLVVAALGGLFFAVWFAIFALPPLRK